MSESTYVMSLAKVNRLVEHQRIGFDRMAPPLVVFGKEVYKVGHLDRFRYDKRDYLDGSFRSISRTRS